MLGAAKEFARFNYKTNYHNLIFLLARASKLSRWARACAARFWGVS